VNDVPKNSELTTALTKCRNISKDEKFKIERGDLSVKMSSVNQALIDDAFRALAWKAIGFDSLIPFPNLTGDIIYGVLSSMIHFPNLSEIYLSDESTPENKAFFEAASIFMSKAIVEYSESEANAAELKGTKGF
jgi:hypothetical protein